MKKYGLQLRVQPSQQKKQPARPPLPPPLGFCDEDEDDVKKEISRQASKNKALKDIEEQHKKALEEDPSMFGYDGVYDEMKEKVVHPLAHVRREKKLILHYLLLISTFHKHTAFVLLLSFLGEFTSHKLN